MTRRNWLKKTAPRATFLLIALAVCSARPQSQTQANRCDAIGTFKVKTYGFQPAKLSEAQQQDKSRLMDAFWNAVKAAGPEGLGCVARLIADEKRDTWFLFDAASLLTTLDKSGASDPAIAQGLVGTSFPDIGPDAYLDIALTLSKRDFDIGPVAHHYMSEPNLVAYLARHGGYKVTKIEAAILMYGSMPPALVDRYLADEVTSSQQDVRDAAAIVWSLNMTEASFKGIKALGDMSGFSPPARTHVQTVLRYRAVPVTKPPKYTRAEILEKIAKFPEVDFNITPAENAALDNSVFVTLTEADLPALREGRRRMIRGVSDESVDSYDEVSHMLMNLINVLDVYREYRIH
jgi:hypothetical protein